VKTAGRGIVIVLAAFGAAIVSASCDREDLTVATLPTNLTPDAGDDDAAAPDANDANDASSDADDDDPPCVSDQDCDFDEYCDREGCGKFGTCQPAACEPGAEATNAAECGCNNVTYYNPCLRQLDGQSLRAQGPCKGEDAPSCLTQGDCQTLDLTRGDIVCARLVTGMHTCDDASPGTCWVLPSDCSKVLDDAPIWRACDSPDLTCESQCQAIANGVPYSYAEGVCH
jgi:hypothetical protein